MDPLISLAGHADEEVRSTTTLPMCYSGAGPGWAGWGVSPPEDWTVCLTWIWDSPDLWLSVMATGTWDRDEAVKGHCNMSYAHDLLIKMPNRYVT